MSIIQDALKKVQGNTENAADSQKASQRPSQSEKPREPAKEDLDLDEFAPTRKGIFPFMFDAKTAISSVIIVGAVLTFAIRYTPLGKLKFPIVKIPIKLNMFAKKSVPVKKDAAAKKETVVKTAEPQIKEKASVSEPAAPPAANITTANVTTANATAESKDKTIEPRQALMFAPIKPEPEPQLPTFTISGIMYLTKGSRAIINNAIVEEGDMVSGATVTRINKRNAVLEFNGQKIILDLR